MARFLGIGQIPQAWLSCPRHRHRGCWEIVLYLEGSGIMHVGDREYPFAPGVAMALPPDIDHWETSADGYRNFHLSYRDDRAFLGDVPYALDEDRSLQVLASELHREFQLRAEGWQRACDHLFQAFLLRLERRVGVGRPGSIIDRLRAEMLARLHEPEYRVGPALRRLGLSEDHVRELFKRETGMTPLAYLTELRIRQAQQHLLMGLSVREAGERAGIADQYYFSRLFRRSTGLSPSAWREREGSG